jgi:hypothetical protein
LNVVAEALLLAAAAGADPAAVRAAIRGGFAGSRILELHGQRMLERNFIPGGQVSDAAEGPAQYPGGGEAAGVTLPVTELVTRQYETIEDLPGADHAAALIALEKMNPGKRLGAEPDRLPTTALPKGISLSRIGTDASAWEAFAGATFFRRYVPQAHLHQPHPITRPDRQQLVIEVITPVMQLARSQPMPVPAVLARRRCR